MKKTADQWFAECAEHHQHRVNRRLQWICTPLITGCTLGVVWGLPVPETWQETVPWFNWALVAMAIAMVFYVRLSPVVSAGVFFLLALCYAGLVTLELFAPWAVWKIGMVGFAAGWVGQMVGRILERRPPSFARDLAFLFLGPAWLVSLLYRRLGQRY